MNKTIRTTRKTLLAATVAVALVSLPRFPWPRPRHRPPGHPGCRRRRRPFEQKAVQQCEGGRGLRRHCTLTGTVDLYEYKADADKRVHKAKGVTAVRNDIQVAGPPFPTTN